MPLEGNGTLYLDGQIGSTEKRPINSDDPRFAGSETVAAGS